MANDPLLILILIALALVAGVLAWGMGTFGKGGDYSRLNSNKIMRYRIAAQFVAICLIVLFVWLRGKGGN